MKVNLYASNHFIKQIKVPKGITKIKKFAFNGDNLESIVLPEGVLNNTNLQKIRSC